MATKIDPPNGASNPGKHYYMLWRSIFEVDTKYVPIKPIGKGAYGIVCSARNSDTGEKDIMKPVEKHGFNDVYLVYELMDTDLHQIIRSSQTLTDDHFQYFIYQLLRGLKYVSLSKCSPSRLETSNLLLNASCDLKICDFGLARTGSEKGQFMTEYVVTRWYRAPELLLSCEEYSSAIDMWSVGCIFAELLGRKPLFPGKDYIHQLKLIISIIGSPEENDLQFIHTSLARLYPNANPLAINLLDKMLVFDPKRRITVTEALEHPYLAMLHDVAVEPSAAAPFDFDSEEEDLKEDALREKVWDGNVPPSSRSCY
ncbi:hypothetical protein O6H91_Y413200 [Diphasiastrum complanatum]|nr:hypothetical protein O6H91_Y413200 [Diphasiastrum complanatum]